MELNLSSFVTTLRRWREEEPQMAEKPGWSLWAALLRSVVSMEGVRVCTANYTRQSEIGFWLWLGLSLILSENTVTLVPPQS